MTEDQIKLCFSFLDTALNIEDPLFTESDSDYLCPMLIFCWLVDQPASASIEDRQTALMMVLKQDDIDEKIRLKTVQQLEGELNSTLIPALTDQFGQYIQNFTKYVEQAFRNRQKLSSLFIECLCAFLKQTTTQELYQTHMTMVDNLCNRLIMHDYAKAQDLQKHFAPWQAMNTPALYSPKPRRSSVPPRPSSLRQCYNRSPSPMPVDSQTPQQRTNDSPLRRSTSPFRPA